MDDYLRAQWRGIIQNREDNFNKSYPKIVMAKEKSVTGGSGSFLAIDSIDNQWWVKTLDNLQNPRVIVNEAIVAGVGKIIGAPVCNSAIVEIPEELEGYEFRPGHFLRPGLAHASKLVEGAIEHRQLNFRDRDDNSVRHVGVFALHDWCWGNDSQWLYSSLEDQSIYSHDHGHYFPNGPAWTENSLCEAVNITHSLNCDTSCLNVSEVERICKILRELNRDFLIRILSEIPNSWLVTNDELESLGWFLEKRASLVADRLSSLGGDK